jgi:hypothetical protein
MPGGDGIEQVIDLGCKAGIVAGRGKHVHAQFRRRRSPSRRGQR